MLTLQEKEVSVDPARWVVLGTFMLINIIVEVLWICYAPIGPDRGA